MNLIVLRTQSFLLRGAEDKVVPFAHIYPVGWMDEWAGAEDDSRNSFTAKNS
jgi:hypothetical protein